MLLRSHTTRPPGSFITKDPLDDILARFCRLETWSFVLYDREEKEGWWMDEIKSRTPGVMQSLRLALFPNPFQWQDDSELGERIRIPAGSENVAQRLADFCGWKEDIPPSSTGNVQSREETS